MESILTSIKKMLGITEEYKQFDPDIIMHINSVFMILNQLGVGPSEGFRISDEHAKWSDFISDDDITIAINTKGIMVAVSTNSGKSVYIPIHTDTQDVDIVTEIVNEFKK